MSNVPSEYMNDFPMMFSTSYLFYKQLSEKYKITSVVNLISNIFIEYPHLNEDIIKLIEDIVKNKNESSKIIKSDEFTPTYLILKILSVLFNSQAFTNIAANYVSKYFYYEISREDKRHIYNKDFINDVCNNIGIKCFIENIKSGDQFFTFGIPYTDYLKLAPMIQDERFRLVNKAIDKGIVMIDTKDLKLFLRELVRIKFIYTNNIEKQLIKELKNNASFVMIVKSTYKVIKDNDAESQRKIDLNKITINDSNTPPCINDIIIKAGKNENLTHVERMSLVLFFNTLGWDMTKIIHMFETLPDYDESITRYQVEFLCRKESDGKPKYYMYNCDKMATLKLCKKEKDPLCLKGYKTKTERKFIKNPALNYVYLKTLLSKKSESKNSQ